MQKLIERTGKESVVVVETEKMVEVPSVIVLETEKDGVEVGTEEVVVEIREAEAEIGGAEVEIEGAEAGIGEDGQEVDSVTDLNLEREEGDPIPEEKDQYLGTADLAPVTGIIKTDLLIMARRHAKSLQKLK